MRTNGVMGFAAGPLGALFAAGVLLCAHCSSGPEGALAATGRAESALGDGVPPVELCSDRTAKGLCPTVPHDVVFTQSKFAYGSLNAVDQRPFDNYGWQAFVALNWPQGKSAVAGADAAPRVWESYATISDVFAPGQAVPEACAKVPSGEPVLDFNFLQASQKPLVDRNGNFVVYDVRMNPVEVDYIRQNGLDTQAGQQAFADRTTPVDGVKSVDFPPGTYDDDELHTGGRMGALEIKSAWRILDPAKDRVDRFYTMKRRVYVPAASSATGADQCFAATLGMVGFHVMGKTTTHGQPKDWMWATFEHVDNAPMAAAPTPQTADELSACEAPRDAKDVYSFFDPACTGDRCGANAQPPAGPYLWDAAPPYARRYGPSGTQVVRCWADFAETAEVNAAFQTALAGSVLANYRLITTQWDARPDTGGTGDLPKPVPRQASNPVAETYDQSSGCTSGCHDHARTAVSGLRGDFSFLLRHAQ